MNKGKVRVLWTHNFDPSIANKGNFIYPLIPYLEAEGVEVTLFYLGKLFSLRDLFKSFVRLSKVKGDYDVIHAQYGSMCSLVSVLGGRGTPVVFSLRGSDWNMYTKRFDKATVHSFLAHSFSRVAMIFAKKVFPVSKRMKKDLPLSVQKRSNVFPSPINLSHWKVKKRAVDAKRPFSILFVAQNMGSKIKGVLLLEKVKELLEEMEINVTFNIAQNIPFEKMPDFVGGNDLLLCLSENEGWPNSVKEALACNIPFVATDVSDLKEIADEEGSCFICFPEPKDVVDKILRSMEVNRNCIDLRKHIDFMDVNTSAKRMKDLYLTIIPNK